MIVPKPETSEFEEHYRRYIDAVPTGADALELLEAQHAELRTFLTGIPEARGNFRYAPEKWSVKDVIGHVSDVERIFGYRMLRAVRADATPIPGFEEGDYVRTARADARALTDLIGEWTAIRRATIELVRGVEPAAWSRRVVANGDPISARALFYVIVGHATHHTDVLRERYGL